MKNSKWRYIEEENVSASYGLATDEYLMNSQSVTDEFPVTLRLYTYRNYAALSGRFQDIKAEINIDSCIANGFQIGRRLTGGGAIIMGEKQLGICLASHTSEFNFKHIRELYILFSQPILSALRSLNIEAGFRAKNDLEVGGKKIAGLGIHIDEKGGLQFHCSLLLDLDTNEMLKVLNIPIQKYSDRRLINSIEQRITTINRESDTEIKMEELRKLIANSFRDFFKIDFVEKGIRDDEQKIIEKLEHERYLSEEWIFQRSPQKDMTGMSLVKTPAGLLRTYVGLKGENIKSVLITGDFFELNTILNEIESELKWSVLDRDKIKEVVIKHIAKVPNENMPDSEKVVEAIWTAAQRALAANRYTYKGSCYYPKEDTTDVKLINENS